MDNNILDYFKQRLLKERERYNNIMEMMKDNNIGDQDDFVSNELSNYDNHPAELGTEVFQVTLNNALKVNEEYNLNQINEALDKIEEGTYGICVDCHREIDRQRLETLPYANKCIECENNSQLHPNGANSRPIEERVMQSPFGQKYLNNRDIDQHEGMDYLNDLMKYGSADSPQDMGGYKDFDEYYTNEIDNQGIVDPIDNISNQDYKKQIPD